MFKYVYLGKTLRLPTFEWNRWQLWVHQIGSYKSCNIITSNKQVPVMYGTSIADGALIIALDCRYLLFTFPGPNPQPFAKIHSNMLAEQLKIIRALSKIPLTSSTRSSFSASLMTYLNFSSSGTFDSIQMCSRVTSPEWLKFCGPQVE